MKKVLFIMQSYPSARSANVLCDDMIIQRLLTTREVEIHCLCMRYHNQPLEEEIGGVHVHRFPVGPYFEFKDGALRRPGSAADRFVRVFDRVVLRANQVFTIPIYPCFYPIRTEKFIREAERLYAQHSFDVIACEHYGYETMMAGFNLKQNHPEVRYLQFFWDALSGGTKPGYLPMAFVDKRRAALEERILDTADCSVAMMSHRAHLCTKSYAKRAAETGRLCFMGIPYLQPVVANADSEPALVFDDSQVNIVFAGNLWGRNVEYAAALIDALHDLDVVLWIITSSNTSELKDNLVGYGKRVRFVPYIPHEKLLGVLASADALLNMGVKNPNAISGKIFEYMGCCKPIISTYSIDDEACLPVLKRYPLSLLVDERRSDMVSVAREVRDFLVGNMGKEADYTAIENEFHNCTPEAYCELFNLPLKLADAHE
ncbi:glycosyltransferase [Collinsella sp. Sow4_E3]|uniref:glycosyltransferase n=1 Tax=Collinsella sp. Sow4_E3 TaxID=3438776 RepID=UPI003F936FA7